MAVQIIYTLVTNGGGVDGLDHTDKGGKVVGVFGFESVAKASPRAPWCSVVPMMVDLDLVAKRAWEKLDPIERYAISRKPLKD